MLYLSIPAGVLLLTTLYFVMRGIGKAGSARPSERISAEQLIPHPS